MIGATIWNCKKYKVYGCLLKGVLTKLCEHRIDFFLQGWLIRWKCYKMNIEHGAQNGPLSKGYDVSISIWVCMIRCSHFNFFIEN